MLKKLSQPKVIITSIILLIFFYFTWANLSRAQITISLTGDFTAQISSKKQKNCTDLCTIKAPSGNHSLSIAKPGYQTQTTSLSLKNFQKTTLNPILEKNPVIEKVDKIPTPPPNQSVSLLNQRLVLEQEDSLIPVVFFSKPLKNPEIITNNNFAIIFSDDSDYLVNISKSTRLSLAKTLPKIADFIPSPDGKWVIYKQDQTLQFLNTQNLSKTSIDLDIELDQIAFDYSNQLFFVLPNQNSTFSFAKYDLKNSQATILPIQNEPTSPPTNLIVTSGGNRLYFQAGTEKFRIILR